MGGAMGRQRRARTSEGSAARNEQAHPTGGRSEERPRPARPPYLTAKKNEKTKRQNNTCRNKQSIFSYGVIRYGKHCAESNIT